MKVKITIIDMYSVQQKVETWNPIMHCFLLIQEHVLEIM